MPAIFSVVFRVPVYYGYPPQVTPKFDGSCTVRGNTDLGTDSTLSASARFELSCPRGLTGTRIRIAGLEPTQLEGLITIRFLNGDEVGTVVHPAEPFYAVPAPGSGFSVFRTYARLGLDHIAEGIDHLLFVTLLVLLIGRWQRTLTAVTAFTIAHSINLAHAALGIVHVPLHAVEASIALSILFMAVEIARSAEDRAYSRAPCAIAFGFGLPHHEIPLALISFNVGVEIGQFSCIGLLLALNLIGGLASYWTILRTTAIFSSGGNMILSAPLSHPEDLSKPEDGFGED